MRTLMLIATLSFGIAALTQAAPLTVPLVISQEGRLTDAQDHGLNVTVPITFTIYEDGAKPSNGSDHVFWTAQYQVTVTNGFYSVLLGAPDAGAALPASVFQGADNRWLGVNVGGTDLTPRMRIGVVPFAVAAMNADTLNGLDSSAFAPAAIVTTVDGIDGKLGTPGASETVFGDLGALDTKLGSTSGDVTTIKSAVATMGTNVGTLQTNVSTLQTTASSISTAVGSTIGSDVTAIKSAVGATVGADAAEASTKLNKLLARAGYSMNCKDSWVALAWGDSNDATGYTNCLHDGRWHMVVSVDSGGSVSGLTGPQLKALGDAGGSFKITTAAVNQESECVRMEWRGSDNRYICVGPLSFHPGSGMGADATNQTWFHFIAFNVDNTGVAMHSPYMYATNGSGPLGVSAVNADASTWGVNWFGPPSTIQAKWWVRF